MIRRASKSLFFRKRPRIYIGFSSFSTDSLSLADRLRNDVAQQKQQRQQHQPHPRKHQQHRNPSLVGGKVAKSKLSYMQSIVDELGRRQSTTSYPSSFWQELQLAYQFWLSYNVRNTVMPNSPVPLQNAVKILQFVRSIDDPSIAEQVFIGHSKASSPNLEVCRLIGVLLQPLQGTNASMKHFGKRDKIDIPVPTLLQALQTATSVSLYLQTLHAAAKSKFQPDALSYQTHLNLIAKRCKFLTFILGSKPPYDVRGRFCPRIRRGISWTDQATVYALDNCQRAKDCVEQARTILQEMERAGIPLEVQHHSIFMSILADASRHDNGMAEYAYAYVERHFGQNTTEGAQLPVIVYNPVLLAHCREAERQRDNPEQLLFLVNQSERIMAQLQPTKDPITFSLMLKLYNSAKQPWKAQKLLDRMYAAGCRPSILHYNTVLDAHAKTGEAEAVVELVNRMEDPDAVSLTIVAKALLLVADPIDWTVLMNVLNIIEQQRQSPNSRPDAVTYDVIFDNMYQRLRREPCTDEKKRLALLTEKLLQYAIEESEVFRATVPHKQWHKFFNGAMRCWTASNSPDSTARSLSLLEDMRKAGVRPNGTTYQCILVGANGEGALEIATELMSTMEREGIPRTATSTYAFIRILLDHVNQRCEDEGFEAAGDFMADRLIDRIEAKANQEDCFTLHWIFQGFNVRLSKEKDKTKKVKIAHATETTLRSLLRKRDGLESSSDLLCYFNESLKAWAFSLSPSSAIHANRLLAELKERRIQPDVKSFEYALTCHSRLNESRGSSVQAAREIFQSMNDMNITISLSILNTFLKILVMSDSAGAISEARSLLSEMELKHKASTSSIAPNRTSYEILWRKCLSSKDCERASQILFEMANLGRDHVEPTTEMFLETIEAWSTCDVEDCMTQAMKCFDELTKRTKPTSSMYLVLQLAWCHSNQQNAADQVESLLLKMQHDYSNGENQLCRPTLNNFRAVILSLTNAGETDKAEKVLLHLDQISSSKDMSDLAPNVGCYELVLRGWSTSNDPNASARAMSLLEHIRSDSSTIEPNQQCYTCAISTLKKSININTANMAYDLLCEMIEKSRSGNISLQPSHETFGAVLDVCASCLDVKNAFDKAFLTIKEYVKRYWPSPRRDAYVKFLQVAIQLNEDGPRERIILDVFADKDFPCPLPILEHPMIQDRLQQSLGNDGQKRLASHFKLGDGEICLSEKEIVE